MAKTSVFDRIKSKAGNSVSYANTGFNYSSAADRIRARATGIGGYSYYSLNQAQKDYGNAYKTVSDYASRINGGEWLSQDDLAAYKNAIDSYTKTSAMLRNASKASGQKYTADEDKAWETALSSLASDYTTMSDIFSKYKNNDEYQAAKKAQADREEMLKYDLGRAETELTGLNNMANIKNSIANLEKRIGVLKQVKSDPYGNYAKELKEKQQELESEKVKWAHVMEYYGSEEALKAALSEKTAYYNNAKRLQEGVKLGGVSNPESEVYDPNFSSLSSLGTNISWSNTGSSSIKNTLTVYDDLKAATLAMNEKLQGKELFNESLMTSDKSGLAGYWESLTKGSEYNTENESLVNIYREMNDLEAKTLAYYLEKDRQNGTNQASEYVNSLKESLNARLGEKIASTKNTDALKYLFAIEAGLDQYIQGRDALFSGEDYIPTSATQFASGYVRESLDETGIPAWYNVNDKKWENKVFGSSTGQLFYDALNTSANMLPSTLASVAVNYVAPGAGSTVGLGLLGASAAGNAKAEMLRLGYTKEQANTYGILAGASEIALEKLLGGIPGLSDGDGIFSSLATKIFGKVDNAIARGAIALGSNALDEGLEEGLQTVIEPWLKEVVTNVDWDSPTVDEVLYSSLLGALSSVGFTAGSMTANNVSANAEAKNTYGGQQTELVNQAVNSDFSNVSTLGAKLQKKLDNGKNLSGGDINRLLEISDRATIQSAVSERLTELGEQGNVTRLASALAKQIMGEELSFKDRAALNKSTKANIVLTEMMPENIKGGNLANKWAEGIGTKRVNADVYNLSKATVTPNTESSAEAKIAAPAGDVKAAIEQAAKDKVGKIEGFTEETANVMVKDYDGSVSPSEYVTTFEEAFKLGRDNAQVKELTRLSKESGVIGRALLHAYDAGLQSRNVALEATNSENSVLQNGTESGIINTESESITNEGKTGTKGIRLRNGGKWFGGKNTEGQIRRMEGGAGQNSQWREGRGRPADGEAARLLDEGRGREVRVADLGILNGSKQQKVRVIDEQDYTPEIKEAVAEAEAQGLTARVFVGDDILIEEANGSISGAHAYILGKQMLIRADHEKFTSKQFARHEIGHDKIAKGQVDIKAVRKRLEETVGKEAIDSVAQAYAEAYGRTGLSADEIWEECICDSLGDMNIFTAAGLSGREGRVTDAMLAEIKAVTESETKAPTQTRGSPEGKASRSIQKAKYLSYTRVGIDNVSYIKEQLQKIYGDIESGIADEIAIARGNKVFIVDSGRENGKIKMGVREILNFSDLALRDEYVRRQNDDAVSEGRVSDELSSKLKSKDDSGRKSNLRRESGSELQADKGKSEDQQGGVSGEDADQRGLTKGKASRELDSLGNELTKEQQEYFKDSKVRDKKGNLMVLYHGTTANFNTFKKGDVGYHFGTKGAARGRVGFGKNVTLKEVYLNITNPIVFDEDLGSWDADYRLTEELYDKGILTQAEAETVLLSDDKSYRRTTEASNKKLASLLVAKGYDGIAYSNTFETKNATTSYIVFNSNQAKEITNKTPTSNPDIRYSRELDLNYDEIVNKKTEVNNVREEIRKIEVSEDFKAEMNKLTKAVDSGDVEGGIKAYKEWEKTSGYGELVARRDKLLDEITRLHNEYEEKRVSNAKNAEQEAIEKSGLSEADYFRKQAEKEFGYTPYFYDAGYILPNGKMLNFSGEKGKHYGTRGEDHRAIGIIYADTQGTAALTRFMNDGNIRIMAESPGLDIASKVEPSREQYSTIRSFIYDSANREYFNVDISDESGRVIGSLEYDGKINPTRIINDIKHYYETGEIRDQSEIDKFRYSRELDLIDYVNEKADGKQYNPLTNRELLASALESVATNEAEREKLREYKKNIEQLNKKTFVLGKMKEDIYELQRSLKVNGKKVSYATFEKQAESRAKSLGLSAKDIKYKKTDDTYSAYVGEREILSADRVKRTVEENAKLAELKEKVAKLERTIHYYDSQLVRLEATKSLKDVIDREKKKAYKAAAEKGREAMHRNVEGRHKTAERHAIKALKDKFIKMMDHPTDKQYIPANLISAMVDVCQLIDTDTNLYKMDGSINKAQQKRNEQMDRLLKLRDEYAALGKNPDPMYSGEFDQDILEYLDELRQDYTGKSLDEMTLVELKEFRHILRAIDETLQDARKLIGWGEADSVYDAGDRIIDDQRAITKKRKGKGENTATSVVIDNSLSPLRNVKRMADYKADSPLVKIFRDLEVGVRRKNKFAMDAYKSFDALTSGENAKKYEDAIYKPYGKEYVDKEGRKFRVSKMEMMQAIMSYNRELANDKLKHVSDGGFTFADLDLLNKGKLKEAIDPKNAHTVNLGAMIAMEFQSALAKDSWAQEYMKTAEQFFDGTAKDAINEANMALKHRILATGSKYIPYEVNKDFVVREITSENDIQQTISGYGMMKDLKDGATQPLIITGLNNILERHIDQVSNIHGLAVPVRNFNKVWNVKAQDGSTTVQEAIKRNFGDRGAKVMIQAVKDVQGSRIKSEGERVYSAIKGNVIGATFMGNGSVVTKQVGSLFTATAKMKWRDPVSMIGNLLYTMANYKKISAEVDKYTASAWMRRQGMSDAELHSLTTEAKKKGVVRLVSKLPTAINPTKWISGMDSMVALSLWTYAKADVAKETGLSGEDLNKAAAEYYDDIIENTQSMSDALHRPEIQKSGGVISEALGTFKTDLYQGAGLMADALGEYRANPTKENANALAKAVTGNVMSAVWGSIMTTAFALLRYKVNRYRDDEDDEIDAESWLKVQGSDLAGDLVGYIVPLFGGEVYDIVSAVIKGEQIESFDNMVLEAINDFLNACVGVGNAVRQGDWANETAYKKLINSIGSIFGVPISNMTRLWEAINLHAQDIANGEFMSFEAGLTSPNNTRLYRAYIEGDADKINKASRLYKDEAALKAGLRKGLRENDPRLREAAIAKLNGDNATYKRLCNEVLAEGKFDRTIIIDAFAAEYNYQKNKADEEEK